MTVRFRALFVLWLAACNHPSGARVTALHDLHQSGMPVVTPSLTEDFYALPWPNALHFGANGIVDLTMYPRPQEGGAIKDYIDTFGASISGAGPSAGIYFRFDGAIDPSTLPSDANASVRSDATAFVVDVTQGSPTYGQKTPVIAHWVEGSYDYIGPYWVVLLPLPGFPLREKTTYAAVLTDGIKADGGGAIARAADLSAALAPAGTTSSDARVAAAAKAYAPFTGWLSSQNGLLQHLVNATVFTTLDATGLMPKFRQVIYAQVPAPSLAGLKYDREDQAGVDQLYEGTYQGPNFQTGDPPYRMSGGDIVLGPDGLPMVQRMETLRVAMTIPEGPMPQAGWPVVIYAHGTGGSYVDFVDDGSAREAAKVTNADGSVTQLAMISIDQVLHGTRAPTLVTDSDHDLAFFNVFNIRAARANPKQGALDDFQLLRLVKAIDVPAAPTTGQRIKFDPDRIYFKGHSQGGLTGPLFLAAEPEVKAAILSGAGGVLIQALLGKLKPVDIPVTVGALLHDPVDEFHPLLSMLQNYLEDADPENYARLLFREPPPSLQPKSIFHSLGIVDTFTPIPTTKALALALGEQPIAPMREAIDHLELAGQSWGTAPVSGNVAGGKATAVLLEYPQAGTHDGHFVIFDVPDAIRQCNRFLASHAVSGTARLDPP